MEKIAVKICGMREPDNILEVSRLSPDFMGFIFYDKTPRNASGLAPEVIAGLPDHINPVAVFVDADREFIAGTIARYGFRFIQLHGSESPEECQFWRARGIKVFKAIPVADIQDIALTTEYENSVDAFLFDTRSDKAGGSGKQFDWTLLNGYAGSVPFLLSGGITPEDADAIMSTVRHGMLGVDINSRFEKSQGVKDSGLLKVFLSKIKESK